MRWSKFTDVSEIGLLMSPGKRVRPKVFYYAYALRTHSHTTGSDRQLKHSCHLGHYGNENWSKIIENIDVLLSPTESKHSVIEIEIEMQNIRGCLII